MTIDAPQTTAEKSPERQQQAADLSRDIQAEFKPGDKSFQPTDHSKVNSELKGLGFPDIQVGNDSHLQDHGQNVQNTKYDNGNLSYDRTGPSGEKQHVTLNMSDHPGLETIQNDKGQVTQTSEADAQGKQHTTDFTYDANGKLTSAKTDGKDVLPSDATNAKVDAKTGQLTYQKDGKTVTVDTTGTATDGRPGEQSVGNQGDDPTKPVIQPAQGDKPAMWQSPGKSPIALPADMDPAGAKVDASGHLVYTNKDGNKVDVNPDNGRETTTTKDGTQITRNHLGGDITDCHSTDPNGPKCENGIWSNLPGLSAEGQKNHLKYDNGTEAGSVQLDPSTGKVKSYVTDAGVTVSLGDNGKPVKYSSNGFSMEWHDDNGKTGGTWYYHQDGANHDYVKIDIPTLGQDGLVNTKENGGIHSGRDHQLNGGGQKTGSGVIFSQTFISGFTRNALHSLIDDNVNTALIPVNALLGTHLESHVATPVDPDHASAAEIVGGAFGSTLGFIGLGKLHTAAEIAKAGKKAITHEGEGIATDHDKQNDPSRWQTWYRWWE